MQAPTSNPFDLSGSVALVTGGIGLGMARALGSAGDTVAILGRDPEKTRRAAANLGAAGIAVSGHVFELKTARDCKSAVSEVLEHHERLDVLLNNAGINIRKLPEDYSEAEIEAILSVDLLVPFHLSVAAFRARMRSHGGSIVNIGSLLSEFGGAQFAPYSMAKGGIVKISRSLGTAWAKFGVRVNAILPGWIDTDLTKSARQVVEGLDDKVKRQMPVGRWGCQTSSERLPSSSLAGQAASRPVRRNRSMADTVPRSRRFGAEWRSAAKRCGAW